MLQLNHFDNLRFRPVMRF